MKKIYVFPLVGAIVTLFGLCFPVVFLYDGVTIWLWGFYIVDHKSLAYYRLKYNPNMIFDPLGKKNPVELDVL